MTRTHLSILTLMFSFVKFLEKTRMTALYCLEFTAVYVTWVHGPCLHYSSKLFLSIPLLYSW